MMPAAISILSGVLLVIMLWHVWKKTCLPEPCETREADEEWASCPRKFVSTVFGRDDWEFVSKFESRPLETLFMRERKLVARAWVRATAGAIHRVMQEHTQITRGSSDLEIGTEVTIYLRYVALQTACGLLWLSIGLIGPVRVRELSLYVYRLSESLSHAHEALKAATEAKELADAGRL